MRYKYTMIEDLDLKFVTIGQYEKACRLKFWQGVGVGAAVMFFILLTIGLYIP